MRGRTSRRSTSSIRPWPWSRPRAPATACFRGSTTSIGDGWPDILVLGRVHLHPAYWYENPRGGEGLWKKHYVFERIQGETPPFADLNQDGRPELICHWENRWGYVAPDWNRPDEPWSFHPITAKGDYDQFYHGTGVGDINGDGRNDLILNDGLVGTAGQRFEPGGVDGPSVPLRQAGWGPDVRLRRRRRRR